jgi:hypothetical protein
LRRSVLAMAGASVTGTRVCSWFMGGDRLCTRITARGTVQDSPGVWHDGARLA